MIRLNYGQEVLTLPAAALECGASAEQLLVLLCLCRNPVLANDHGKLSRAAGYSEKRVAAAIAFWTEKGILSSDTTPIPTEKSKEKLLPHGAEIPLYDRRDLSDRVEKDAALRDLIDESQKLFGKIFSLHDVNLLIGLTDYLGLSSEYIMILLSHCKEIGVDTMRGVEQFAIRMADAGVTTPDALEEHLQEAEASRQLSSKVRKMFGMKAREMTAKEKKTVERWIRYGYGEDIIRRAYEITVDATGNAAISYTDAIIERWHAAGVVTLADAERVNAERAAEREQTQASKKRSGKKDRSFPEGSFETDELLEAALQRSFDTLARMEEKKDDRPEQN